MSDETNQRALTAEELTKLISHTLAINLASCAVMEAEAELEIRKAQLKQTQAKAGVFRSHLASTYRLRATESIDEETGVISLTPSASPTPAK